MSRPSVDRPSSAFVPSGWDLPLPTLRRLDPSALDHLVERWLLTLQVRGTLLWERRGRVSTYEAHLGDPPLLVPVRVRIHQSPQPLSVSHVEAFLGYLVRSGSPVGILATTGEVSWGAALAARSPKVPRVHLVRGEEWAEELSALGLLPCPSHLPPNPDEWEGAESLYPRREPPRW